MATSELVQPKMLHDEGENKGVRALGREQCVRARSQFKANGVGDSARRHVAHTVVQAFGGILEHLQNAGTCASIELGGLNAKKTGAQLFQTRIHLPVFAALDLAQETA